MPITEVLETCQRQLQDIADTIAAAKKVVVITGAGISTNCGIPDFRSDGGLYSSIREEYQHSIDREAPSCASLSSSAKGKELFDSMIWRDQTSTAVFYKFIASLRRSIQEEGRRTSATHRFIRTLRDRRKLVRCYTQNIDSLEAEAGLCIDLERGRGHKARFTQKALRSPQTPQSAITNSVDRGCEVVQLHGDLQSLRCTLCQGTCDWEGAIHDRPFFLGKAPRCVFCSARSDSRREMGKRGTKVGTLRPNVVLYGEEHPAADAINNITTYDLTSSPDVLLVMGTSLHVHGLKTLVREFAKAVHVKPGGRGKAIFINLSRPAESAWKDVFDFWVNMDCDDWVSTMKNSRPEIWQSQSRLSPKISKKKRQSRKPEEADKENVIPDSQESLPCSWDKLKVVVHTPKRQMKAFGEPTALTESRSSPYKSRKRIIPDSDPLSSLPSPPLSEKERSPSCRKRGRSVESVETTLLDTPSKRRRNVQIWEDQERLA